jgi:tetratricopeptide (TPR) repeat protein
VCESCFQFFQERAGRPLPIILSEDKIWLVKSSLKIQGPFDDKSVLGAIRNREFASLDEACKPRRFWSYFRDTPQFQEAVKDIAVKEFREDDTVDITQSMTGSNFGTDPGIKNSSKANVVDVNYKNVKPVANPRKWAGKVLNIGLAGILGVALVVGGIHYFQNRSISTEFSEERSRNSLEEFWEKGQYSEYLSEAKQLEIHGFALSDWDKIREAAILVWEDQGFLAEPILNRLTQNEHRIEKALLESKIAFQDRNTSVAIQKLESLSRQEQQDQRVKINLSFLKIHSGNLKEGKDILPTLAKTEDLNSNRAVTEMYFWLKSGFEYEVEMIDNLETSFSYYIDALASFDIFRGLIYLRSGHDSKAYNAFSKAISTYPVEDSKFKQNLFMIPYSYRYEIIEKELSNLQLKENPALEASIRAYVALKLGNRDKAIKYFNKADTANPNSSLVKAWKDYLIYGEIKNVPFKLDPMFFSLSSPFKIQLTGEKCLKQKNWDCASKSFQKLIVENPRDYMAVYGLLQLHELRGDKKEASQSFKRGIGLAPRFIPFLKLEDKYL